MGGFVPIASYITAKRVSIKDALPQLRFTEIDQADPTGRFRIKVDSGNFLIEKKMNVGTDWRAWTRIMKLNPVTRTAEFFSEGGLEVHVDLQGRPDPPHDSWITPLTVVFFEPGTNNVLRTEGIITDNEGNGVIGTVVDGTYDIGIKCTRSLSERQNDVVFEHGVTTMMGFGPLREGDCNNDDVVGGADYSILMDYFGETSEEACLVADFNRDGVVSGLDYALLWLNYNQTGDLYGVWP